MIQSYLQSKLSGYIGIVVSIMGVIISDGGMVMPLIPAQYQATAGNIIVFLGVLKTWIAASPFVKSA